MKDMHDWDQVMKLFKSGVPKKQIARNLRMSKNKPKDVLLAISRNVSNIS